MSKITNAKQYEILVGFMETHTDLAKGFHNTSDARVSAKSLWIGIADQLNAHGPPVRNHEGWKKVWSDYKFHIKKKMKLNKLHISGTGGGPYKQLTFSPIEETVIRLCELQRSLDGTKGARDFGDSILNVPVFNIDSEELNLQSDTDHNTEAQTSEPSTSNNRQTKYQALQQQISIQQQFHNNIKEKLESINTTLNDTNTSLKRLVRLKEKSFSLREREMKIKEKEIALREKIFKINEKQRLEEYKMKLDELEIKRKKLDLQENKFLD